MKECDGHDSRGIEPRRDLWLHEMPAKAGLVPSLNGLRALSIIIVYMSHWISDKLFPGGFAVRVFFIISGFLITRLTFAELRKRGKISIPQFYIRRFLRLYPVILAYTIAVVLIYAVFYRESLNWAEPLSALLYFANYYYANSDGLMPFAIFWSLSVEEHFYLVFPFIFVLIQARPQRLIGLCCIAIAACLSLRLLVAYLHPELRDGFVFYYETQYQLDSISCGVLLAALCECSAGRWFLAKLNTPLIIALAAAMLVAGFAIRDTFFRETLRYSIMNIAIATLLSFIVFTDRFRPLQFFLNTTAMDFIGRLSYSVYVWHYLVIFLMFDPDQRRWATFASALILTIILSCASYFLLERPLSSLRHKFGSIVTRA